MDKVCFELYKAYWNAKLKVKKFMEDEEGDVIQTIIVIALGVIIAGLLLNFLTKEGFELTNTTGKTTGGLVDYIFDQIKGKVSDLFSTT